MKTALISAPSKSVKGSIRLSGSKSISNRVLLIRALSGHNFNIHNLSDSDDTNTLSQLLSNDALVNYDTGHAGTTFRFLTAYLSLQEGKQFLTGSDRMKQRPIGPLVDALSSIGATINYAGEAGYPPLEIGDFDPKRYTHEVTIGSHMSSQYISALLMIAPTLPKGLKISLDGDIVSMPYIEMTLQIMEYFGILYRWIDDRTIDIAAQTYMNKDYHVESDWSAASYFYLIAGLADEADITLQGLTDQGLQGDSQIVQIGEQFGIHSTFGDKQIRLTKSENATLPFIELDFLKTPDIAQTIAALCAGLGVSGLFTGLQTLKIKETDRVKALQNELAKMQVYLSQMPAKFSPKTNVQYYMQEGKAQVEQPPSIATYHDHRMAMSFAPLAMIGDLIIEDPDVVSKSYLTYWQDLELLGFSVQIQDD